MDVRYISYLFFCSLEKCVVSQRKRAALNPKG